jgi:hypothetical protein
MKDNVAGPHFSSYQVDTKIANGDGRAVQKLAYFTFGREPN